MQDAGLPRPKARPEGNVFFLSLLDVVVHMPPTIHCSYCVQKTLPLYNIRFSTSMCPRYIKFKGMYISMKTIHIFIKKKTSMYDTICIYRFLNYQVINRSL